ncbi:MAG: GTP-binding protein [Erysipelotrichaceae bacterium]|nr:GTP-binding protein [Erysipelotrichaceae bacterium]
MIKPVYIFEGFLDAGKTSAIIESMYDPYFNDGTKNLLIAFEDGEIGYDEKFLKYTNSEILYESLINFNHQRMEEIEKNYNFDRIIIEFNGMDNILEFVNNGFIKQWELAEIMCFINSQTFNLYFTNMQQLVYNQIKVADVVIFNRYTDQDKRYLRNNLKAVNPKVQIVYENTNREIMPEKIDEIFDLSSGEINVNDLDYGLWYMDALDNPKKYENIKVTLNMKLLQDIKEYSKAAVFGRQAMVCCAADIAPIGLTCLGIDKATISENQYYKISGIIHLLDDTQGNKTCVLYVDKLTKGETPNEELVMFK